MYPSRVAICAMQWFITVVLFEIIVGGIWGLEILFHFTRHYLHA